MSRRTLTVPQVPERALRVAVLSELPTPYRWPLFRCVADDPALDVTLLFYAKSEADRDWGLVVPEGGERPRVEFMPGRTVRVSGSRSLFFHWNPGIGRRLATGDFDVVVIPGWSMPTSISAALWCRAHAKPYVVFSETNALRSRRWWVRAAKQPVVRTVVGGASAWLATGSLSRDYLVAHGARADRVRIFANTPDVDALATAVDAARPRRCAVRAAHDTPADAVVALFVGRLIGAKDPAALLAAWALLEAAPDAPWLWIAGDGPEAKTLRDEAARLSLSRVRFLGSRRPSDLPEVWAAADLFALPSRHEPWGVVVNEAMAASLPLVLSDRVGAAYDLLHEGENGHMVPAGDAAGFARAIRNIASDASLRRTMGATSRRLVDAWSYGPSVRGFVEAVRIAMTPKDRATAPKTDGHT
ncbi:MAG: glycosyltransferase family 4 protein [Planctomycetes bacterium]|nr:glycosyltransferase family 4 protein [Planctomycetota bacterium]